MTLFLGYSAMMERQEKPYKYVAFILPFGLIFVFNFFIFGQIYEEKKINAQIETI